MPKTTGFAVGKLTEAQALLHKAADAIISARLDTSRLSDVGDEFRGTALDDRLHERSGSIIDLAGMMDQDIRDLAQLIPDNPEE